MSTYELFKIVKKYTPATTSIGKQVVAFGCEMAVAYVLDTVASTDEIPSKVKRALVKLGYIGIGAIVTEAVVSHFERQVKSTMDEAEKFFGLSEDAGDVEVMLTLPEDDEDDNKDEDE